MSPFYLISNKTIRMFQEGNKKMNFFNRKIQKIVTAVIAGMIVLSMVVSLLVYI